jgi:hypothetical protein
MSVRRLGTALQARRVRPSSADVIADLERVRALRQECAADASLDVRGASIKAYQHQRFARDYGALLAKVMQTVRQLSALHALTEGLDHEIAKALSAKVVDAESYRRAWSLVGRRADRERQLALLLAIGQSLDKYARQQCGRPIADNERQVIEAYFGGSKE